MNSEKAFDMLPYGAAIYKKLDIDTWRKKKTKELLSKKKKIDEVDFGIETLLFVIENSAKVKEEFFQIVAIADDIELEEAKSQSLGKTIQTFKKTFMDPELQSFFKQAMQSEDTEE